MTTGEATKPQRRERGGKRDAALSVELKATQSRIREMEERLATFESQSVAASPVPLAVSASGWYLCPLCKGLGEIQSDEQRKILRGVKTFGHIRCTQCGGVRMIKVDQNVATSQGLRPIKQCPKCRNFYAIGGGHPANETNDPFTRTSIGKAQAHSHWHDLSIHAPSDFVQQTEDELKAAVG